MSQEILFLHGGVINRHMWDLVRGELSSDPTTRAIDLPGHGDLSHLPYSNEAATEVAIEALTAPSILVGLSLGGYVAQMVAATRTDLVSGMVLSGATIDYRGWDGLSTKLYGYAFPLLARPAMKTFAKKLRADFGPEFAEPIIESGLSARGAGQALRRLPGRDYASELVDYSGPIVIANGERDTSNRKGEARFIEKNPQARVIVIEDAGHACAMTQPASFAAAVESLLASVG